MNPVEVQLPTPQLHKTTESDPLLSIGRLAELWRWEFNPVADQVRS